MAGIIRRHAIPTDSVFCFFMQEYVDMSTPVSNGSMPIVCLFDNGALIKEYDRLTIDEAAITDFLTER